MEVGHSATSGTEGKYYKSAAREVDIADIEYSGIVDDIAEMMAAAGDAEAVEDIVRD